MSDGSWRYESKYIILQATPDLQERFREAARRKFREEGQVPSEEEVEEVAALGWRVRAKEVCAKGDLLAEEGVAGAEIRNILRVDPPSS